MRGARCSPQTLPETGGGKRAPVAELWEDEQPTLLPLPSADYAACSTHLVKPNPYSQVQFETNRYSVPATYQDSQLVLQAYPFRIKVLCGQKVIADHSRCLEREQDVIEPLHYLSLLEQRPGAFRSAGNVGRLSTGAEAGSTFIVP